MSLPPPVNRQDEYLHHIAGLLAEQVVLLGQLAARLAPTQEARQGRVQISEPARPEPPTAQPAPPPSTVTSIARAGRRPTGKKGT